VLFGSGFIRRGVVWGGVCDREVADDATGGGVGSPCRYQGTLYGSGRRGLSVPPVTGAGRLLDRLRSITNLSRVITGMGSCRVAGTLG